MYSRTINEIKVIVFTDKDKDGGNFYSLIVELLGNDVKAILDFAHVTAEWQMNNLFGDIKNVAQNLTVQFVIINLSEGLAKRMPVLRISSLKGLIEAVNFLTGRNLNKCVNCESWLPSDSQTVSLGSRWCRTIKCPSCGLLHDRDGQPVIHQGNRVFLTDDQIKYSS